MECFVRGGSGTPTPLTWKPPQGEGRRPSQLSLVRTSSYSERKIQPRISAEGSGLRAPHLCPSGGEEGEGGGEPAVDGQRAGKHCRQVHPGQRACGTSGNTRSGPKVHGPALDV